MTMQEEAEAYKKFRNEEALEYCRKQAMLEQVVGNENWKHYNTAAKALEEVKQYRALGTVEELKEALEKQVAKELNNKEIMETVNKIIRCLKKQKNSYFTDVVASTISMLEEFDEVQFEYWSEEDEED